MFRRVRVCLSWDREAECSTLLDKEWEGDDANSSFYRIVEADKKSQIMSEWCELIDKLILVSIYYNIMK